MHLLRLCCCINTGNVGSWGNPQSHIRNRAFICKDSWNGKEVTRAVVGHRLPYRGRTNCILTYCMESICLIRPWLAGFDVNWSGRGYGCYGSIHGMMFDISQTLTVAVYLTSSFKKKTYIQRTGETTAGVNTNSQGQRSGHWTFAYRCTQYHFTTPSLAICQSSLHAPRQEYDPTSAYTYACQLAELSQTVSGHGRLGLRHHGQSYGTESMVATPPYDRLPNEATKYAHTRLDHQHQLITPTFPPLTPHAICYRFQWSQK